MFFFFKMWKNVSALFSIRRNRPFTERVFHCCSRAFSTWLRVWYKCVFWGCSNFKELLDGFALNIVESTRSNANISKSFLNRSGQQISQVTTIQHILLACLSLCNGNISTCFSLLRNRGRCYSGVCWTNRLNNKNKKRIWKQSPIQRRIVFIVPGEG